jgi:hypothetical protein
MGDDWDVGSWFGGDDGTDLTSSSNDWNMNDWYSGGAGNTNAGDWSYGLGSGGDGLTPDYGSSGDYSNYGSTGGLLGGGASSGSNSSSPFGNYSSLIGPGLNALGGAFGAMADQKNTTANMKLQEQLAEKLAAANAALQEQYYQAHGKQLSDAYSGYAKYDTAPGLLNISGKPQSGYFR